MFAFSSGKALEKAGGKEFLDMVKELRKSQGPLEVTEGEIFANYVKSTLVTFLKKYQPVG